MMARRIKSKSWLRVLGAMLYHGKMKTGPKVAAGKAKVGESVPARKIELPPGVWRRLRSESLEGAMRTLPIWNHCHMLRAGTDSPTFAQRQWTRFQLFVVLLAVLGGLGARGAAEEMTTQDGFAIPQQGRVFAFPRDHGSHPEFRTEWWYLTGHLDGSDGRRFGFQATFFRQASRLTGGAVRQLFLADVALLDAATGKFISQEQLHRDGWDAGASPATLDVRNGNWSLTFAPGDEGAMELATTVRGDAALTLRLTPVQPLVVFGEKGVSRKGASPAAASHYLTFPRLAALGVVRVGAASFDVKGEVWMDHEFSSSSLDADQVGWDWAGIQLKDGREIMVYRMRLANGTADAASSLTWVDEKGALAAYPSAQFQWQATRRWHSARSGVEYPNHVRITVQDPQEHRERSLELRPVVEDQELRGTLSGLPYWEGACDVLDEQGQLIGRAYLELAGYAGDLRRHLGGKGASE